MKHFTILLALYILVLSLVPCSDVHADCNESNHQTEFSQNHHHQSDDSGFEECSPFCGCNCCNTVVGLRFEIPLKEKVSPPHTTIQLLVSKQASTSAFFGTIWQPPKLA